MPPRAKQFWREKALDAMTPEEWEALCARCGRCCLVKLEDGDTGHVDLTDVCCDHLDASTCRCTRYPGRASLDSECISLTPEMVAEISWLPASCAYRLVAEGLELPSWHPLLSGDPTSVHEAGASVSGRVIPERLVPNDELEEHIVDQHKFTPDL